MLIGITYNVKFVIFIYLFVISKEPYPKVWGQYNKNKIINNNNNNRINILE